MAALVKLNSARRSAWIPWAFAGAFVVVLLVNVVLVVAAARSWTGLVTETPFDTGNDYNRIMAETQREAALGWKVEAQVLPDAGKKVRVSVLVHEKAGSRKVDGIAATLLRPIGMHAPVPLALKAVGGERYEAAIKLPERGNWDLRLTVSGDGGELHTTKRLFVP